MTNTGDGFVDSIKNEVDMLILAWEDSIINDIELRNKATELCVSKTVKKIMAELYKWNEKEELGKQSILNFQTSQICDQILNQCGGNK